MGLVDPTTRKKSDIPEEVAKKLIPHVLVPPRLYRLPKIHKKDVPLRLIVNYITSPMYLLVKHLMGLLSLFVGQTAYHIMNSRGIYPETKHYQPIGNRHPDELRRNLVNHKDPTRGHTADVVTAHPQMDYKPFQSGPDHNLLSARSHVL
jgi:hypothetical protein